jgi:hypothetical protein
MRRKLVETVLAAAVLGWSFAAWGQAQSKQENTSAQATSSQPAAAYRLHFVFSEWQGGNQVNARSYEVLGTEGKWNKLRTGVRVPVTTGPGPSSYQYLDVGINIDCRAEQRDGGVELSVTADSSNFTLPEGDKSAAVARPPVIQQLKSQIDSIVPLGKPTVLSTMDDPSSTRRFQLEVTATRIH